MFSQVKWVEKEKGGEGKARSLEGFGGQKVRRESACRVGDSVRRGDSAGAGWLTE